MEIFEITGYKTGISRSGVTFLQPSDSFQNIKDGYIFRQVLQSRQGIAPFAPRLADNSRVTGIFTHILPDGTRSLLVTDKNYLYKFNTTTGVFDQISFGGSMAAYGGFSISSNADYVSGVSYPTKDNTERFVFTGRGIASNAAGSSIFFYDGTDVQDYTAVADNADFVQYAGGNLQRATHVLFFNERLNFIIPEIASDKKSQGILFSGIRDSSGTGDDFNAPGSGLIQLDTYEDIKGASILGNFIALNLSGSNWLLEKTTDAFNPYIPRKIPSVIGTDATFSFAQWDSKIKSMGKTGILSMDTRESLRTDNKIPDFTRTEINQQNFDYTFGGFDRRTSQFMWTYEESGSGFGTQDKVLVNNYEEGSWSVYDLRLTVISGTDLGINLAWDDIDETEDPSWEQWDTTEDLWNEIGLGESVEKTIAGNNDGFIYELNRDYDDHLADITAISQAAQAVLTVDASSFKTGDKVIVENVEGMTEINNFDPSDPDTLINPIYTVVSATNTSVTLNVDSQNFTAYTTGGKLSKVIDFEATLNEFNPYREQGMRCYISMVEFLVNTNGGYLYIDIYLDGETTPFKKDVLIKPTNTLKDKDWVSMAVNQEANFFTFVFKQQSPSVGVKLTSTRIHALPGNLTSG